MADRVSYNSRRLDVETFNNLHQIHTESYEQNVHSMQERGENNHTEAWNR